MSLKYLDSDTLIKLASLLQENSDLRENFQLIQKNIREYFTVDQIYLSMINPRTRNDIKTLIADGKLKEQSAYDNLQIDISSWIIHNNKSFYTQSLEEDPRFKNNRFKYYDIHSVIGIPLKFEGLIIGALILINTRDTEAFVRNDFLRAQKLATLISPYIYNVHQIEQFFNSSSQEKVLIKKYKKFGLIGKSQKFIELLHSTEAAAYCDVRVLLEGETGTGKELIARAIHKNSSRAKYRFVAVDCGAIPTELLESELFGHTAGAYTGATSNKKGLFEIAEKGTLFMDEIANLSMPMQSKLLRVLQAKEIRPLGSTETRDIDVRVIAASSKSLRSMVDNGKFREDLFYRLHVYPITVPSLQERHEDIPLLANYFLRDFNEKQRKNIDSIHPKIIELMLNYHWQGNIRELENLIERLVALTPAHLDVIDFSLIPEGFLKRAQTPTLRAENYQSLTNRLEEIEKGILEKTLSDQGWNQSAAARILRISESNIRYKIKKFDISK